ncbi:MAG: hypothetical protein KF819_04955 [Labilithrix sp.]|nr:hypothetical protein [Labilithrix sp.]
MKTTMKIGLATALALALAATGAPASASGLAVDAGELPAKTRASLRIDIDRARGEAPDLFRQVDEIVAKANEIDAASRRPGAPLTMHFKVLGPRALMPMLELLAWGGQVKAGLTPTAHAALRVGLIEAVGIIRDGRAVPVLARIVDRERDVDTTRAAADALGRIGTHESFGALTAALGNADGAGGERLHAILIGIGASHRLDAARLLARRAEGADEATARAVAKALGTAGNAWAWKTLASRGEESAVREVAARALVKIYVEHAGEARTAASNALLVVGDAHTATFIADAKRTASADVAAALDALAARMAKNPVR